MVFMNVNLTFPISSPIIPFQDPLAWGDPYFPSATWYISYLKPRILARASRTSMENPLYLLGWPKMFSATITNGSSWRQQNNLGVNLII